MANKNNNKKQEVNSSIIEVVVNGMSAIETIEDIKLRIESLEKSVFNIALECAYALGKTIPAYIDKQGNEHGEAICTEPISTQAKLVELVGRSSKAISRWMIAMDYVLDNGYFTLFANGTLPFSYDKIITIFSNNDVFENYVFADLMAFTVKQLQALVDKKKAKAEEQENSSSDETNEQEATEQAEQSEEPTNVETTVISYNGQEYTVPKQAFEQWLADNAIVNVEK